MIPWIAGYLAGLDGEDPRLCPHEKMTAEWAEWQRGHGCGVAVMEEQLRLNGAVEPPPDE